LSKFFSSIYYTIFTVAKVWQENEEYFSEKPRNWSDLPKRLKRAATLAGLKVN
jgi:hypothetical protein